MRYPNWKDHSLFPYSWAILIFLCSRMVVALGLVFSQKYLPIATDVWSAGPFWYHQLLQWDSEWYFRIATEGYRYNGDPTISQNIVFYPLYPMLARGLAAISGLAPSDALLLAEGVCEAMRKPIGIGSNVFCFSRMLRRLRQYQDWCTNGPCAGSISPVIPVSILQVRSAVRFVML